jgi:hypothetical protein
MDKANPCCNSNQHALLKSLTMWHTQILHINSFALRNTIRSFCSTPKAVPESLSLSQSNPNGSSRSAEPSLRVHHSQEVGCVNRALNDALNPAWWHPYAPLGCSPSSPSFCLGGIGVGFWPRPVPERAYAQNISMM